MYVGSTYLGSLSRVKGLVIGMNFFLGPAINECLLFSQVILMCLISGKRVGDPLYVSLFLAFFTLSEINQKSEDSGAKKSQCADA